MYTFWKRTIPPPSMMVFDAAGRETCAVRHSRTNTPLQALILLNDMTYVEAARKLGRARAADRQIRRRRRTRSIWPFAWRPRGSAGRTSWRFCAPGWSGIWPQYQRNPEAQRSCWPWASRRRKPNDLTLPSWPPTRSMASVILNLDETITKE